MAHKRNSTLLDRARQLQARVRRQPRWAVDGLEVVRAELALRLEVRGVITARRQPSDGQPDTRQKNDEYNNYRETHSDSLLLPPNGPRLSCSALVKDSFPNLRALPASSAC